MTRQKANKILDALQETYSLPKWTIATKNPFETLIKTIISQNTNDQNTARAFERLSNRFRIVPEILAKAKIQDIERSIKVAGLYRNKSRVIKHISQVIVQNYESDMNRILQLPLEDARNALLSLHGVGPKTADVVLLFAGKRPTIPVDTHVNRVSKRLGLVSTSADYEAVRRTLQSLFSPSDFLSVHILLIMHGRRAAKLGNPCAVSAC
jgi:endonuclease-3